MSKGRLYGAAIFRGSVTVGASVLLAACMSFGDKTPVAVYAPQVRIEPVADAPKVDWSLLIARPRAGDLLDSERIAVRPEPGLLQPYKAAAWSEPLPDLLQSMLLRGFEDSGRILGVARQASGVRGDVTLLLDIRRFESEYRAPEQAPTVVLEVQAKLVAQPAGKVLAARTFKQEAEAAGEKLPAVTAAFESASSALVAEMVGWSLEYGAGSK
ncbi:MAG TPA: ABC-type transport auxiliary lipoprotein family protein [Arenimonas sp.]|nr:ABC-type transport auxiliary lipoprotein family protein [Arenimonas sp.]